MSVTDLPAPPAARLRMPGWRDPRLLVGLALVALSAVAGSMVVSAASRTVSVYAAAQALVPGTELTGGLLREVQVRGVDADLYLSASGALPDAVVLRTVAAGELVPRSALGGSGAADVRPVTVPLRSAPGAGLVAGAVVDVWFTPAAGGTTAAAPPSQVVAGATVAAVHASGTSYSTSAGTVEVLVPAGQVGAMLAALAGDGVVDVVVVPGAGS